MRLSTRSIAWSLKRCGRRMKTCSSLALQPLETARARRTPIEWRAADVAVPELTGVRVLEDFSHRYERLRELIDWTPLWHTWGLKEVGLLGRIP